MTDFKYIEGIQVPINICSYRRSKSIKIYVKEGYIKITKPIWYGKKEIIKYIEKNKQYINDIYQKNKIKIKNTSLLSRDYLLFLGEKYKLNIIEQLERNSIELEIGNNSINIYIPKNLSNADKECIMDKCIKNMYKNTTYTYVNSYLQKYCDIMNIPMHIFRIKNCKTIWGSCSSKGNLSFNLKLAMLPSKIIEQIVVHELCHLRYMNHSKQFWDLVYKYCDKEEYLQGKKWIKENVYN